MKKGSYKKKSVFECLELACSFTRCLTNSCIAKDYVMCDVIARLIREQGLLQFSVPRSDVIIQIKLYVAGI